MFQLSIFSTFETVEQPSAEDESAMILRAQGGDEEATLTLLATYAQSLRWAVSRNVHRVPLEERERVTEDAQAEAVAAFLQVIKEHDPEKSPRLAGRVAQRVRAALAEASRMDAPLDVPERTLSRFYGILRDAEGDIEKAEERAPKMGMSRETFREVLTVVRKTFSLTPATDGEEEGQQMLGTPLTGIYRAYDEVEDRLMVETALASIEDDEARIVELAYGFTEYEPVPDGEIAHRVGLTRPTVQRKRAHALSEMRKTLGVTSEIVK